MTLTVLPNSTTVDKRATEIDDDQRIRGKRDLVKEKGKAGFR